MKLIAKTKTTLVFEHDSYDLIVNINDFLENGNSTSEVIGHYFAHDGSAYNMEIKSNSLYGRLVRQCIIDSLMDGGWNHD